MAKQFFFLSKKKAFRFFNILFISYNNFIINYKRVHTLAQLTNTLASTNTKQSTHSKVCLHVVQNQHNSQILQQAQIQSLYKSGTLYRWLTVFRKLDVVMSFASYLDQSSSRRCCSTVLQRSVSRFMSSAATLECLYQLRLSSQFGD